MYNIHSNRLVQRHSMLSWSSNSHSCTSAFHTTTMFNTILLGGKTERCLAYKKKIMCSVCYLVCFRLLGIVFRRISNCTNKPQPTNTGMLIASWAWKLREQISPDCEELNIRTANTWWCLPPSNTINLFERQGLIPASTFSEISPSVQILSLFSFQCICL